MRYPNSRALKPEKGGISGYWSGDLGFVGSGGRISQAEESCDSHRDIGV